jgi:hypothetical protein
MAMRQKFIKSKNMKHTHKRSYILHFKNKIHYPIAFCNECVKEVSLLFQLKMFHIATP